MTAGYSYQHSAVFASLKNITEQLPTNLTTSQYLQALDLYLQNATTPVVIGTRFFDAFLSRLVGWQEKNFRRKVSFSSRKLVPSKVINFLLQPSAEGRVAAFAEIKLDRGILVEALGVFYERLELYMKACNCELSRPGAHGVDLSYCLYTKTRIEEEMFARVPLPTVLSESKFWLDRSIAFKQLILEKYTRLCLTTAKADYVYYFKHSVKLDDIIHWYWIAASRAIDKCDSGQGALTSHIQNWFKTARFRVTSQRDQRANVLNIETLDFDSDEFRSSVNSRPSRDEEEDRNQHVHDMRYLAKLADPIGVARAYLCIEELLDAPYVEPIPTEKQ
jgi:hypothetical protein